MRSFSVGNLPCLLGALGVCAVFCAVIIAAPQLPGVPDPQSHSWARFGPRAWKVVRVKTDSFNDKGEVEQSSIRTTRMQVTRVSRRSYSLCVSSSVDVAGNRMAPEPQTLTQTFDQNVVSSQTLSSETLTIGNREYVANVLRVVSQNEDVIRTSTIYYSRHAMPEVLKRNTISKDLKTGDVVSETAVTVTEVDHQRAILDEMLNTWTVSTVFKKGGSVTITKEVHCEDIPGELVSRETEKRDSDGRVVIRSKLDLIGYGYGLLRRARRRHR